MELPLELDAKFAPSIDKKAQNMEKDLTTYACTLRRNDWSKLPTDVHCLIAEKISFPPILHKLALSCREWCSCLRENPIKIELPVPDQATVVKFKKIVERSFVSRIVVAISNYLRQAVISESPSLDSNCLVAAILSNSDKIAICRLGDETWSTVNASSCKNNSRKKEKEIVDYFEALAIYKGKIYAARRWGSIAVIDYQGPDKLTMRNIAEPNDYNVDSVMNKYLVELAGELLFVERYGTIQRKRGGTFSFEVHKLEEDKETWKKVRDLEDRVILLGPGGSLSVSTRDVPWFRPNCIYFIDDFYIGESPEDGMYGCGPGYQIENVIFSLESNFVEKFDLDQHILGFWPTPAMWYQRKIDAQGYIKSHLSDVPGPFIYV
ncbi:F-box SKIP23-like protein (DUF295) [Rhynchospora pubera]|uniref:F-box SKIP23-like protein (DUF295) n=1 Tax=Rhynchospora pubera TaxID=906938 RepID=A0AAV8GBW0_9POAL|nr:F-box SKIP23-like protein (DUF295) [Rhynchospora pubera]